MIVYTCPKCGGNLRFSIICTYPPIDVAECSVCGWKEEKRDKIEEIPYKTNTEQMMQHDQMVDDCLLKDELCSKADIVAMLEKLQAEIEEIVKEEKPIDKKWANGLHYSEKIIQQKINALKEVKDGSN